MDSSNLFPHPTTPKCHWIIYSSNSTRRSNPTLGHGDDTSLYMYFVQNPNPSSVPLHGLICKHNTSKNNIIALTETWLKNKDRDAIKIAEITPPGYKFLHYPRRGRRGGGVAVLMRTAIQASLLPAEPVKSFESIEITLTTGSACIRLLVLYRPPPSKKNKLSKAMFLEEFADLLERRSLASGKLIIVGDFNFHWGGNDAADFKDLLASFNLTQHVVGETNMVTRLTW